MERSKVGSILSGKARTKRPRKPRLGRRIGDGAPETSELTTQQTKDFSGIPQRRKSRDPADQRSPSWIRER